MNMWRIELQKSIDLDWLKTLPSKKIVVIGDVILDQYVTGIIRRISPEAPVPIMEHTSEYYIPGGAANVAMKVKELGGTPLLVSAIGLEDDTTNDFEKTIRKHLTLEETALVKEINRTIPLKTRYIAGNQHIMRMDNEEIEDISQESVDHIVKILESVDFDVVIISDYDKGIITDRLLGFLRKIDKPFLVDPKDKPFIAYSGCCTWIKPNEREAEVEESSEVIRNISRADVVFITHGKYGMYVYDGEEEKRYFADKLDTADPTGAGDAVCAVLGVCLANDIMPKMAAELSNIAGRIICEQIGNGSFY